MRKIWKDFHIKAWAVQLASMIVIKAYQIQLAVSWNLYFRLIQLRSISYILINAFK